MDEHDEKRLIDAAENGEWARVKITSDGTAEGTMVSVAGKPLAVRSLKFETGAYGGHHCQGCPGLLTLEIYGTDVDIEGDMPIKITGGGLSS